MFERIASLVTLFSIAFAAFLALSCGAAPPVSISNKPVSINDRPVSGINNQPKKPIGQMSWTGQDSTIGSISDYKGKVLILDFWATFCAPCREEIPHLKSLKQRYPDDLVLIGLHAGGEEDRPKIPAFVSELRMDYPVAFPEDALLDFVFQTDNAIPKTLVIDREGNILRIFTGFDETIGKEIDRITAEAVSRK